MSADSSPAPAPGALRTERLVLRRWRPEDREPFAQMNADPAVMEYFPAPLDRVESDAFADRIEASFGTDGFGPWAVERQDRGHSGEFVGFTGLLRPRFDAHFTPAVEVGWRLARSAWGLGFAPEAARAAVSDGFERVGLAEVVSFTAAVNERSVAVMRKIGMTHDPADDFDHPALPAGHWLRRHVLYRLAAPSPPAAPVRRGVRSQA